MAIATFVTMTANFFLNNNVTYRERRLRGARILPGLAVLLWSLLHWRSDNSRSRKLDEPRGLAVVRWRDVRAGDQFGVELCRHADLHLAFSKTREFGAMNRRELFLPIACVLFLLAYFWFFTHAGLSFPFDNDDMYSTYMSWTKPWSELLLGLIAFWKTSFRPAGLLFHRSLFEVFGFDPLPFRIACLLLTVVNLGLVLLVRPPGLRVQPDRSAGRRCSSPSTRA